MVKIIFFVALLMTLYTYIIFPVLLFFLVSIINRKVKSGENPTQMTGEYPSVALLCAMYNEEKVARSKIDNFFKLNYHNIKFYIGSDGSTDGTNELLRRYSGRGNVAFYEFPRRGKVHVINDLVEQTQEDIVIFTDANSLFEPSAITALIKYFSDPQVGAVCGMLKMVNSGKTTGEGFYWRYETSIKKLESSLNCVVGANGALYGVRRELLAPLPSNTINDDFTNSMRVVEQGYGIKYAADAVAYEELHTDDAVEFNRHIRDGAGHYRAMAHLYRLLNPLRIKIFFLYVSHRVIRWFVPFYLMLLLIIPFFYLDDLLIRVLHIVQMCFYLLALIGWISKTKIKMFYIPYYFISINIALLIGFVKNAVGRQKVTWSSTAR